MIETHDFPLLMSPYLKMPVYIEGIYWRNARETMSFKEIFLCLELKECYKDPGK